MRNSLLTSPKSHENFLSAGLALIPLALGGGEPGNEIQCLIAVVVLGGLLRVVVRNMLVVPALFLRYGVHRPCTGGASAPSEAGVGAGGRGVSRIAAR